MFSDINIGRYYSTSSRIHKMNPVAKIIFLLITILLILLTSDIMMVAAVVLTLFVILNAGMPYRVYLEILNNLKTILIIIFLLFLIFGLVNSLIIVTKIILIVLTLSILTLTTPTTEIIYGLEKVLYPLHRFKIKTNILALNIGLGLKFMPCLIDSRNNILKSQISRGIDYRSNLSNYIFAMTNMIKPSIKIAKNKFNEIKEMMYMRLYSVDKQRCNFRMNDWKIFDTIIITIGVIFTIIIILKGMIL